MGKPERPCDSCGSCTASYFVRLYAGLICSRCFERSVWTDTDLSTREETQQ